MFKRQSVCAYSTIRPLYCFACSMINSFYTHFCYTILLYFLCYTTIHTHKYFLSTGTLNYPALLH